MYVVLAFRIVSNFLACLLELEPLNVKNLVNNPPLEHDLQVGAS